MRPADKKQSGRVSYCKRHILDECEDKAQFQFDPPIPCLQRITHVATALTR